MRKLCLLALFCCPLAMAQVVKVETNSLMRLPNTASTLQLERLEVADYGTLLIPANVTELKVDELRLGHEARIAIVPTEQSLHLTVRRAELEPGSQITSRGAPGTYLKAAKPGRNLNLRIESLQAETLSVDARGGAGAPGYVGLDGANGQEPGCTWGSAGRGLTVTMAAMAVLVRQAPRSGWNCRETSPASRSRSGSMVAQAGWPVPVASRVRAASPRGAWCTAPTVARADGPAPRGSLAQPASLAR